MNIEALVVKIAGRCNINCSYCYMYNHADKSYLIQPKFMSAETIVALKHRIKNHCAKHNIDQFAIVLHGGEPLLMKKNNLEFFLDTIGSLEKDGIRIIFAMQTNGMLITEEYCELFNRYHVGIGVSLDGTKDFNDKFRVDKKGNGTYDKVIKGVEIAKKNLNYGVGCLSVINTKIPAIKLYELYRELGFTTINLLLLDENHDSKKNVKKFENANWLIELFDYWFDLEQDKQIQILKFQNFISYFLGDDRSTSESSGTGYNKLAVIETNGDIESLDVLKICGESFTKQKFNVENNEFDDIFQSELIDVYYNSKQMLCKKCLACPVKEICGGGYLPHRYSSENGFNNPSVYCDDLLMLLTHMQNKMIDSLPDNLIKETQIEKLSYDNAVKIIADNISSMKEPAYAERLESFKKNKSIF